MKRITMILIATLALALLVYAQSRTPVQTPESRQAARPASGKALTPAMRDGYMQLIKSGAGESGVRAWARKHKLEIVRLKGYDILVIPEQAPVNESPFATKCDATKCQEASGTSWVNNTHGQIVGYQNLTCIAKSCKWVKDPLTGGYRRMCGDWKCKNDGSVFRL